MTLIQAIRHAVSLTLLVLVPLAFAQSHDPFESTNRVIYRVNDGLDQAVLRPLSVTYQTLTPDPMERGVRNFFQNIGEVRNATNNLLQGKWRATGSSSGRFLINSTVGLLGVFDVARHIGIDRQVEDFGQTLGVWGVGPGPYLVLPLLGPSNVRDSSGFLGDIWLSPLQYSQLNVLERSGLATLDGLQTRADLLGSDSLMRGDGYLVLREAYLSKRNYDVSDGKNVSDSFLDNPVGSASDEDFVDEGGFGTANEPDDNFVDESF
ncbi:MlaA family lipoprotein [Saccharospirillum impatiens]|uniref:MlaA family lipoprotein n=1 Tax=Saccharospirillum impatiens TaxID=169438 RepID=UPI0003F9B544|nr:VacJ family lipoprotein [Saccharospirillum impatiens]